VAVTEEEREHMLDGLLGLRRVRALLPANEDVERGIVGIQTALGETVPQRTAARALGVSHPEVSKLISAQKLLTIDNVRGKAQVSVASLLDLIEAGGGSADGPKRTRKWSGEEKSSSVPSGGGDIQQIMELRALAFHRALARNLDRPTVDRAREVVVEWRESGQMTDDQADEWERILDRPVPDVASKMTDYSPAGHELRKNSPFNSMGRRADD
jgi:hypothetical protein